MSITIQPELESRLRARAEAEGLTVEAYIEQIARDDEAAEEELEVLALAGLNSGEAIPVTDEYWEQKRRRIIERHQKTGA
jgi:antitoxin ParD1/3/4